MGISRAMAAFRRRLQAEPPSWAVLLALAALGNRVKGAYLSRILGTEGLRIGPRSMLRGLRHISVGRDFFALDGLWLEAVTEYRGQTFSPRIRIGDSVRMSSQVHISCIDQVTIGNKVLFGSKVYVSDNSHGAYSGPGQSRPDSAPAERPLAAVGPVVIGDNVWIGDNVVILGPATIGAGSILGANSYVRGTVPPATIMAGSPARPIKAFDPETGSWEKC